MPLTREQLDKIVETGDFHALIGASENLWLECKGQPYQLNNDEAKRELAKDVSSFANAQGGRILVGVQTKSSATHFGDEIEKIRPFPQNLVNITQYIDVVGAWVYPSIEGFSLSWVPTTDDNSKGVVVIDIPEQVSASKPYLVVKTFDGAKFSETLMGYAERKGDTSKPLSVMELQAALRAGLNYDSLMSARFESLEMLIKAAPLSIVALTEKTIPEEKIEARNKATVTHAGMQEKRHLVISAVPTPPSQLRTIFTSKDGSIRRQLENPPQLRWAGWDLTHHDQAKIVKGESLRVENGDAKIIELYRDGMMAAAALADSEFLAWGRDDKKQRLNPLALIEFVFSFLNFYSLVLKDIETPPSAFTLRMSLHNMHLGGVKTTLGPYGLNSMAQQFGQNDLPAPTDSGMFEIVVPTEGFEPTSLVFDAVKEIYLWFGIEEDKIPYFKSEAGKHYLDTASISKM